MDNPEADFYRAQCEALTRLIGHVRRIVLTASTTYPGWRRVVTLIDDEASRIEAVRVEFEMRRPRRR